MRLIIGVLIALVIAAGTPDLSAQGKSKGRQSTGAEQDYQNAASDRHTTVDVTFLLDQRKNMILDMIGVF